MSFYIKQYRDNSNHWSDLNYAIGTMSTKVSYFIENEYRDVIIAPANSIFKTGEKYFLSVEIDRIGAGAADEENSETGNTEKEMVIKLLNGYNIFDTKNQYIDTIILPKTEIVNGEQIKTDIFNFIITPNADYERIAFILSRDLTNINDTKLVVNMSVKRFVKLKNLIGDGINISGSNINITQIGIHARPGTLMCINGEPIKIGKRGVFELNSVFKLQQHQSPNGSQDSTTNNAQNSDSVGIYFLNIINLKENGEDSTDYYAIDYRYVQMEEAT